MLRFRFSHLPSFRNARPSPLHGGRTVARWASATHMSVIAVGSALTRELAGITVVGAFYVRVLAAITVLGAFFLPGTSTVNAQEIRGLVRQADGATPASGVVAVMLHGTRNDSIVARSISNDAGRFFLKIPAGGSARLRLLRIGYEPMDVGSFTLAAGEVRDIAVTLSDVRLQLASFDIKVASRCEVRPSGGLLVAQLFEQARTALIAATAPVYGFTSAAQFIGYTRQQDRRGKLLSPVKRTMHSRATIKPYASVSVDALERTGYVVPDGSGFIYYAPDAQVLLSDKFLAQHCLQLAEGKDSLAGLVGIGFRPVAESRKVDVRGTLWLDRRTSELQFLEYTYEPLSREARSAGVGGRVDYAQMANGAWFVSKWSVRMPMLTAQRASLGVPGVGPGLQAQVSGLSISGGEVQNIRVDDQLLFLNTDAGRAGEMSQDAQEARDAKSSVAQRLAVRPTGATTFSSDSSASSSCNGETSKDREGMVRGRVLDDSRRGASGVAVKAEWKDAFQLSAGPSFRASWKTMSTKTTSGDDGTYMMCGLPTDYPVSVSAQMGETQKGATWTRAVIVRVTEESPAAQVDLPLAPLRRSTTAKTALGSTTQLTAVPSAISVPVGSQNSAMLVTNVMGQPIAYASVTHGSGVTVVADSAGRAAMNTRGLDTMQVLVRRAGYQTFQGDLVRDSRNVPFTVSLLPAAHSPSAFTADVVPKTALELSGFYNRLIEEQRGAVIGEFLTPEEIESRPAGRLSEILAAAKTVRMDWKDGKLTVRSPAGCAMAIAVDGRRIDAAAPTDKLSIEDKVAGNQVSGIEIYPSAPTAPATVQPLFGNGSCGLIAIWTGGR